LCANRLIKKIIISDLRNGGMFGPTGGERGRRKEHRPKKKKGSMKAG
jgi:hypothetical protein